MVLSGICFCQVCYCQQLCLCSLGERTVIVGPVCFRIYTSCVTGCEMYVLL